MLTYLLPPIITLPLERYILSVLKCEEEASVYHLPLTTPRERRLHYKTQHRNNRETRAPHTRLLPTQVSLPRPHAHLWIPFGYGRVPVTMCQQCCFKIRVLSLLFEVSACIKQSLRVLYCLLLCYFGAKLCYPAANTPPPPFAVTTC